MKYLPLFLALFIAILAFTGIYRKKYRTKLHNAFLGSFICLIIWDIGIILQLMLLDKNMVAAMYADFIAYIGVCYLPVTFLLSSIMFFNANINFSWEYKLLFVLPTISLLIIWTNDLHHLFYVKYSIMNNEFVLGPYFIPYAIHSYGYVLIGLFFFLFASIRKMGIFSKQALLILIGFIIPVFANILYTYKIIPLSNYWTPVLFSFFVLSCFIATSGYNFLNIVPIALRTVVDNIPDIFIVLNEELTVVDYNKALENMLDSDTDIERGNSIVELLSLPKFNSIDNSVLLRHINNSIQSKTSSSFEKRIVSHDIDMHFRIDIIPMLKSGNCIGVTLLLKDVTEYKKSLSVIAESQALLRKERHDFINHLNTLNAMYQYNKPDTLERMGNYIIKLAGNSELHRSVPESGNECIDALLSVKINSVKQENVHFETTYELPLSDIDIDDVDLISIIGNIIDNAFDAVAMNEQDIKKIISVYAYKENNKAYISISNNGPKIPDEYLDKIFVNKFTTKSEKEGERGYGLYITKELVTKNMGEIHVTSTESGTEFLLELNLKGKNNI